MRIAKCRGLSAAVTVLGTKESVVITGPVGAPGDVDFHPGWTGDIDAVIGERVIGRDHEGKPLKVEAMTIADALGDALLTHFDIEQPAAAPEPKRKPAGKAAEATTPGQE